MTMLDQAMTTRILLVEDEPDIASVVVDYLKRESYLVEHLANGQQALEAILSAPPDLVLLDVMLPGRDGISVLELVRRQSRVPVVMLTARVEEVDRLLGLALGADDYVCKPFSPREVVARVKAVLRRSQQQHVPEPVSALVLDTEQWQASLLGQPLSLTRKEFELLRVLSRQPGRIFARTKLLELAYADDLSVNERAVDSHIKNLRRKLATVDDSHEWIRSVYGVGFSFEDRLVAG
jgi:two-component system response regulator BaeR